MKRLTKQLDDVCVYIGTGCKYNTGEIPAEIDPRNVRKVLQRLAAYENTGLEPEEIQHLLKAWEENETVISYVAEIGGADRLRELVQADKSGRLVVLPCKVGDLVYALWDVPSERKYVVYCSELKEVRTSIRNSRLITTYLMEPIEFRRGRRREYRDDDFGKTVFLTREEAEAALEGANDENRAD